MRVPIKSRIRIRQFLWNWPFAYNLAYYLYKNLKFLIRIPGRLRLNYERLIIMPVKRRNKLKEAERSYASNPMSVKADTFVLYRVLGNDLPPRHQPGQTQKNLEFMLKHEPELQNCIKVWVLNRIVDPNQLQGLKCLLDAYGKKYFEIPFDPQRYSDIGRQDEGDLSVKELLETAGDPQTEIHRLIAESFGLSKKTLYAMNINGAKNLAKWVCPWDGNCFLTNDAWQAIQENIKNKPWIKYWMVPMARITKNELLLKNGFRPEAKEEPQIIFRNDAREEFDPYLPYGQMNKVELLKKLGVPGKWDYWTLKSHFQGKTQKPVSKDRYEYDYCGWVARLNSGNPIAESSHRERRNTRDAAIVAFLTNLDLSLVDIANE